MSMIACVPNVSEGRRQDVIKALSEAVSSVRGVRLLDSASDAEMNRSVLTFIGSQISLKKAVYRLMQAALEYIDLSKHRGKHPRMGIVDVIPFVPIGGATMEQCIRLAKRVGQELGESFGIPIYLYEQAATSPERISVDAIRNGEFEGFKGKITKSEWRPDFGPARVHPTAGVTAVGARYPLHALNIELSTVDFELANRISEAIYRIGGDPKKVKTLVMNHKPEPGMRILVSVMNYKEVPLFKVIEAAREEAAHCGVEVTGVEVVGLVVADALLDCLEHYMRLVEFDPMQVLELNLNRKR